MPLNLWFYTFRDIPFKRKYSWDFLSLLFVLLTFPEKVWKLSDFNSFSYQSHTSYDLSWFCLFRWKFLPACLNCLPNLTKFLLLVHDSRTERREPFFKIMYAYTYVTLYIQTYNLHDCILTWWWAFLLQFVFLPISQGMIDQDCDFYCEIVACTEIDR